MQNEYSIEDKMKMKKQEIDLEQKPQQKSILQQELKMLELRQQIQKIQTAISNLKRN